jgi:hypothetical protein
MSRYHPDRDPAPTLNAARRWADRCLAREGSIFAENENLWTPVLLDELDRLFIQNYDEGEGSFISEIEEAATDWISGEPQADGRGIVDIDALSI